MRARGRDAGRVTHHRAPLALAWSSTLALALATAASAHAVLVEAAAVPGYEADALDVLGYVVAAALASLWLLPSLVAALAASLLAPRAADRWARASAGWSALVAVVGALVLVTVVEDPVGRWSGGAAALLAAAALVGCTPAVAALLVRRPAPAAPEAPGAVVGRGRTALALVAAGMLLPVAWVASETGGEVVRLLLG